MYGRNTFGQSCLLARRLVEAGTRVVEVIWPKVANSDNHSWDHHVGLSKRMKKQSAPMLDAGLSGLITDLDDRGMLDDTLVVAVGEFGRSPQRGVSTSGNSNTDDGRDHWPYCYTAVMAGAGVQARLCSRQERQDRVSTAGRSCPSGRSVGDDLSQLRHSSRDDRLQPLEPTSRVGQGPGSDAAVDLNSNLVSRQICVRISAGDVRTSSRFRACRGAKQAMIRQASRRNPFWL